MDGSTNRRDRPDAICLDLLMPELDGLQVLHRLKDDPGTRDIPVLIVTSKALAESERREILRLRAGILPKASASREETLAALARVMEAAAS